MFQIRWRWPLLFLFISGTSYLSQYYTIGGIEHLQLKPRADYSHPAGMQPPNPNSSFPSANPWDTTPSVPGIEAAHSSSMISSAPYSSGWKEELTVGEKLAVWQEQLLGRGPSSARSKYSDASAFPASTPIPIPPGFQVREASEQGGIPLGSMTSAASSRPGKTPPDSRVIPNTAKTIRIASFNTSSLGPAKISKPHVLESLVNLIGRYDVTALQGVQSSRDDLLPIVVEKLNQSGRRFDYLIGPRVGRAESKLQFAIVFDTDRIETDRYQLYTVDDPQDLMNYEPLVGWFRCKDVPTKDAFTFSLVNLNIDRNFVAQEQQILPELIDAVERDGRGEDDWIVLGNFGGSLSGLTELEREGSRFAIRDIPTDVAGIQQFDTIFFSGRATSEFTGRSGAFDFLRSYNLTIERAMEISERLPIWAEFSVVEGSQPGRVAPAAPNSVY